MRGLLVVLAALALSLPLSAPALAGTSGVELEYLADGSVIETAWAEETDAATAAAFGYPTRCKRVSVSRKKTNGAWTFWSYYQRQGFCHNGSRVNSLYDYLRRNNGTGPGWEFKGHVSKWSAGGCGQVVVHRRHPGPLRRLHRRHRLSRPRLPVAAAQGARQRRLDEDLRHRLDEGDTSCGADQISPLVDATGAAGGTRPRLALGDGPPRLDRIRKLSERQGRAGDPARLLVLSWLTLC